MNDPEKADQNPPSPQLFRACRSRLDDQSSALLKYYNAFIPTAALSPPAPRPASLPGYPQYRLPKDPETKELTLRGGGEEAGHRPHPLSLVSAGALHFLKYFKFQSQIPGASVGDLSEQTIFSGLKLCKDFFNKDWSISGFLGQKRQKK